MSTVNLSHRRTHNLLLISKLLSSRDTASPLTVLLDSLEQPAVPVIKEYIRRAKWAKTHVTFIAFETIKCPAGVDAFVPARRKRAADIVREATVASASAAKSSPSGRRLILIDAINPLLNLSNTNPQFHLPAFLGAFLTPDNMETSMVVIYHQDVPGGANAQSFAPSPLSLLTYMATTIVKLHSFSQIMSRKVARDRSLAEPVFGLEEEQDGVLIARRVEPNQATTTQGGVVLELEHRRKSGRGVLEWYYLPPATRFHPQHMNKEVVTLLDDHPLYRPPAVESEFAAAEEEPESTFELRLTERQRREREGVVLPYFDAQKGNGPGEGGRILYDLGEEDDFDEEEDEI